ncbi:MAG: hypothetical protein KDK99_15985 [Verrucomicrobiales bacterium]|nr:hypothetical protein [Verrucomicrobiales bacterium]
MSKLAEIESAVPDLGLQELVHLEQLVRETRLRRERKTRPSALDLPPLTLGKVLRPLDADDDLLEEMIHDARA